MARATHTDFTEFVRKQQPREATNGEPPVDWDKERIDWLTRLDELYEKISEFLDSFIEGGAIRLAYSGIELTEENIGSYMARELHIEIGKQIVTLRPIGTMLIGTKGRVDILGSAGTSRFILADKDTRSARDLIHITIGTPPPGPKPAKKQINWVWKIVSAPPAVQFTDLNKDTLFQVLMEVSNG
jgi:hypothetical protein